MEIPKILPKPVSKVDVLQNLREQRLIWKGYNLRADAIGMECARIAMGNIDKQLDHYPNGSPRDHLVMYDGLEPPTEELKLA